MFIKFKNLILIKLFKNITQSDDRKVLLSNATLSSLLFWNLFEMQHKIYTSI